MREKANFHNQINRQNRHTDIMTNAQNRSTKRQGDKEIDI